MRREFLICATLVVAAIVLLGVVYPAALLLFVVIGPLVALGVHDCMQTRHTIMRNFPLVGRFRYLFELIRPEINQYFIESNTDGRPFSREQRSIIYQRAKSALDTLPFGTQKDLYEVGYEWVNHSLCTTHVNSSVLRKTVGGPDCKQPYSASLFNVSAMSFGAISKNAVLALNGAAKDGGFAHNTGEGGISPYHLEPGGDLIWQIGTGYFGCRTEDGLFCDENFLTNARQSSVKMIEIKLSQGAKPGHGGILPGKKVDKEIALTRGVPIGEDVLSPPSHSAFDTPIGLLEFVARLRELSDGKPIGFKLCLGKRREFLAICKAMEKTGITPDFIAVDGGEGGTGAAPLEFSNHIGSPGIEALIFVHNCLSGFSVRDRIAVFASGKVSSAFGMIKALSLGADAVYSARAMMMALGCIQALRCNSNHCPTGIATQRAELIEGLVVGDKRTRVASYHRETLESLAHMLGAMGLQDAAELRPWHIMRRISPIETKHYGELFDFINQGDLLRSPPPSFQRALAAANAESFRQA